MVVVVAVVVVVVVVVLVVVVVVVVVVVAAAVVVVVVAAAAALLVMLIFVFLGIAMMGRDSSLSAMLAKDQVYFTESVWNLPLVLDFQALPWWDVFFSLILLLVNLGMQVMFSLILFTDDFAGDSVNVEEEVENARKWRTSIAHDWRHMDLGQTSLVSRVCQGNGALIISTPQAELVGQINSFLGWVSWCCCVVVCARSLPNFQAGRRLKFAK